MGEKKFVTDTQEALIERLNTLINIGKTVHSTLDLQKALELIVKQVTELMKAEASSLLLVDERDGDLTFQVAEGTGGEKIKHLRIPMGKGIAGWVAEKGESLLVGDVAREKRFSNFADELTQFKTKSIICAPLISKGKTLGVIEVINKKGGEFTEDDLRYCESIADQAAITVENAKLYTQLRTLFMDMVRALTDTIDAKDSYTHGHSQRVAKYALLIARELGVSEVERERIYLSGLLHDIGKIGVPERILDKPGKLTEEEFAEVKKHPVRGYNILKNIEPLKDILPTIRHHHERYDGKGYPDGLKGDKIPLGGKILAVADTFDAIVSERSYRPARPKEKALAEIIQSSEVQFDPKVVEAFSRIYEKGQL